MWSIMQDENLTNRLSGDHHQVRDEPACKRRSSVSFGGVKYQEAPVWLGKENGGDNEQNDQSISLDSVSLQRFTRRRKKAVRRGGCVGTPEVIREQVGCSCGEICDPISCECAANEIACQVENHREAKLCACSADGCGNPSSRVEYDQERVNKSRRETLSRTLEFIY